MLSQTRRLAHKARNAGQSVLLVGGIGLVTAVSAWLLWGPVGVAIAAAAIVALFVFAPRLPPEVLMRMYRASKLDPQSGNEVTRLVATLAQRAALPKVPDVYIIPSTTLNAFATGRPEHAVIGITQGLLQRISLRELAGVLGHEISHVRNNDLTVLGVADTMTRFTQMLSYLALFLAFFNLPRILAGEFNVSLLGLLLLYLAPTIASLLQLGLSRAREYDADLEGAFLTGDPQGLSDALQKLERYQGNVWEDLLPVPGRRIPEPSLLRTHPTTAERVARLQSLAGQPALARIEPAGETMAAPARAVATGPRYRLSGLWY